MEKNRKIHFDGKVYNAIRYELSSIFFSEAASNPKLNKQHEPANTIFHYTSLPGLVGIVESQSLFATDYNCLNDKMEIKHGIDLILNLAKKQLKNAPQIFEALKINIQSQLVSNRYITCFSKKGDLLSQWRAYANNGIGISIGFDTNRLENCLDTIIESKHVEYDQELQISVIEEIVRIFIDYFTDRKDMYDWTKNKFEEIVAFKISDFLGGFITSYKHPTFSEEAEFRFIHHINDTYNKKKNLKIKFRTTQNLIVPYIELSTKHKIYQQEKAKGKYDDDGAEPTNLTKLLPIEEIIVGPSLDFNITRYTIEELLTYNGYDLNKLNISQSKIPYRV